MHIPAEAVSRFAADASFTEGFAQIDEVPTRRLDQHVTCGSIHARLPTAHHSGDRKRTDGIGHQFNLGVQLRFRAIQQGDLLAWVSRAGDNGRFSASPFPQQVIIEGVQGLTDLEHSVVGGIHQRVDRAHTSQREPALHPVGAFASLGAFHHAQHEARIELRVAYFQADFLSNGAAFLDGNALGQAQRSAQNC